MITNSMKKLSAAFNDNGFEIRIVGGAVRDFVMNKAPKDIDFATNATPDQMIEVAARNNFHMVPTGLQHGTVTIIVDGDAFEVTTLRVDTDTDGRHATVEFTTDWETDAARRDFTMNAMYMDMDGNIHDYFGGMEDIENNRVRFVGDANTRIREDYLRILRYFRFVSRFRADMDENDLDTIQRNVTGLRQISGERIWMEVSKIVMADIYGMSRTFSAMNLTSVSDVILGSPFNHFGAALMASFSDDPVARLAAAMFVDKSDKVVNDWKVSANERDHLKFLMNPNNRKDFKKLATRHNVNWVREAAVLANDFQMVDFLKTWEVPTFPVRGQDLLDAGMSPGKQVGQRLAAMRKAWEDSDFTMTKDELLA